MHRRTDHSGRRRRARLGRAAATHLPSSPQRFWRRQPRWQPPPPTRQVGERQTRRHATRVENLPGVLPGHRRAGGGGRHRSARRRTAGVRQSGDRRGVAARAAPERGRARHDADAGAPGGALRGAGRSPVRRPLARVGRARRATTSSVFRRSCTPTGRKPISPRPPRPSSGTAPRSPTRTRVCRSDRRAALEPVGRRVAEQLETHLERLQEATYARVVRAQAEVARLERRTWNGIVVALGAAVVLALAATAVIAFRITRSVRRLSEATAAVAAGSFREPIPVGGHDELGVLARAFNAMASRLRQLDEMKEEFFAIFSHELRSPLTSVREAAHLLADGVPGPLDAEAGAAGGDHRTLERPAAAAGQPDPGRLAPARRAAADRAGAGGSRARRGPRRRRASSAGGRGRDHAAARARRHQVRRHGRRGAAGAGGRQPHRQRRALHAHGRARRPAHVDAGPECEVQVEDTGIGIPAAELPHVFETYRQAHAGTRRHRPRAGDRAGPGAGARRTRHRRVPRGQGQPVHGAAAARWHAAREARLR